MAIFNNDRFFRNISEYDDYLYYVVKKEGYEAGYTLKLIAPFISASGQLNFDDLIKDVIFIPDARFAAKKIMELCRVVVISTAPLKFVEKTAKILGFKEIHASDLDFKIEMDEFMKKDLIEKVDFISSLSGEELYRTMEEIFSKIWNLVDKLKVIGAKEKAEILESYDPKRPIAIGDSITDCKMFEKARELDGIAIAFNGNKYAIEKADFAVISYTAKAHAILVEEILKGRVPKLEKKIGKVFKVSESKLDEIVRESMKIRVKLRGLAGSLG